MRSLGVVQAQGFRELVQDLRRGATDRTALQPGVVLDADACQGRYLATSQAGHPTVRSRRQSDLFGAELRPSAGQELPNLNAIVHDRQRRWGRPDEGGTAGTRFAGASLNGVGCGVMDGQKSDQ